MYFLFHSHYHWISDKVIIYETIYRYLSLRDVSIRVIYGLLCGIRRVSVLDWITFYGCRLHVFTSLSCLCFDMVIWQITWSCSNFCRRSATAKVLWLCFIVPKWIWDTFCSWLTYNMYCIRFVFKLHKLFMTLVLFYVITTRTSYMLLITLVIS